MPAVNTYGVDTATAREFQRLAELGDIRNHATFNPAWLDGATDVTTALNNACSTLRGRAINELHCPTLILPPGSYRISDTIDARRVSIVAPSGAQILAQEVGAGKAAISWDQTTEVRWGAFNGPCAENLHIKGRNTMVQTSTFTANSRGISCGVPGGSWRHCHITNFDRQITWNHYGYIQKFDTVDASYGGTGLYWPSGLNVAGENINFSNCVFGNNQEGFYVNHNTSGGLSGSISMFHYNSSIDYNVVRHGRILGPTASGNENDIFSYVAFIGGHMETKISTSGSTNARLVNGANMMMNGVKMYENENGTYPFMIETTSLGRTSLLGNFFGLVGNNAWCGGAGSYWAKGNTQRWGGPVKITATITDSPG